MTNSIVVCLHDSQGSSTSARDRKKEIEEAAIKFGVELRTEIYAKKILIQAKSDDQKAMFQFKLWLKETFFVLVEPDK